MGYAAVRGGLAAIRAAEELVRAHRASDDEASLQTLTGRFGLAIDRVQSEAGIWAPEMAARAFRQSEGDLQESVHLLRSHRSTLPRFGSTLPAHPDAIRAMRRIVPAYGNPPGPQLLGHTTDYAGRLLDFDEGEHRARAKSDADTHPAREPMVRLSEVLREQDLLIDRRLDDDDEAVDIMVDPWVTPAPRSARLAVLSRGETGALVNLWYQGVMGPKAIFHEITLGEVRHGHLPVAVKHPYCGETVDLGEIRVTEVEAIEDTDGRAEDTTKFDAGYGFVIGHNERKAIAMSVLDISIERAQGSELEQRVLATCDGLESTGFLEHLKLPHYVTFRSIVERKLRRRSTAPVAEPSLPGPGPAR